MADRRGTIVPLLIIAFIFFAPDVSRSPIAHYDERPTIEDAIAAEQKSSAVLQNSSFGDIDAPNRAEIGLNLTGLEPNRSFAWNALPQVKKRAEEQLVYALGDEGRRALEAGDGHFELPLYRNITGHVQGPWVRSKIQESVQVPQLNLSSYAAEGPLAQIVSQPFARNITGTDGDIRFRFHERSRPGTKEAAPANVTGLSAEMTVHDASSGQENEVQVYGVYFMDLGQAIMTTTSDKLAGIFLLPHLALSESTFSSSRALVNESISKTIQSQKDGNLGLLNPWPSRVEANPSPFDPSSCELIIYLQQLPPTSRTTAAFSSPLLGFLEKELRFPTGAFLPSVPELRFSMLAFSPDCGYVLESKGEPDYTPQQGGTHLAGPKVEALYIAGRHHLLGFSLTTAVQLFLLIRQMREANTPSTRSRISYYSIAMLAQGDGFAALTFVLLSAFMGGAWVQLASAAFLALISVSFFGMRFIMDLWTAQAPERERRAREEAEEERARMERLEAALRMIREERNQALGAARATTEREEGHSEPPNADAQQSAGDGNQPVPAAQQPTATTRTVPGSLPLPVTAQRPTDTGATPVFMPSDQQGLEPVTQPGTNAAFGQPGIQVEPRLASFGSLYARFYLFLLAILFLSLNAASWPSEVRRRFFTLLALVYLSFWTPQIWRNAYRNCRRALTWEFVLGQSALRLVPFAYFYAYPHNVLFAKENMYSLALLAFWIWVQVVILGSQELIGPRWFVKKEWVPPAYDYHPVLRNDEEGGTLPIGFSEAASTSAPTSPLLERRASLPSTSTRRGSVAKESKERGKRIFDCAICMQEFEVPIVEAGSAGSSDTTLAGGFLARRNYMVTPCRHIFHSACLEGWMKYRLQCPICREGLPPL